MPPIRAMPSSRYLLPLRVLFDTPPDAMLRRETAGARFLRSEWELNGACSLILDRFPDTAETDCCFWRIAPHDRGTVRFLLDGAYAMQTCPSGGWLLKPGKPTLSTFWVPQVPVFRTYDSNRRMTYEAPASLRGFDSTAIETAIDFDGRGDAALECVAWRLPAASTIVAALERPIALETQSVFMLSSHATLRGPADVYDYLSHGHVYENRFDFRRKRRICSELEAYALYVALGGLEAATGKELYRLLRRQILFSVVSRQMRRTAAGVTASGPTPWSRTTGFRLRPCSFWRPQRRTSRTAPSKTP